MEEMNTINKKKKRRIMTKGLCNHHYDTRFRLHGATSSHKPSLSLSNQRLVSCTRKRNVERHTPYLPKDIIFQILVFLPARVLYDVMRYVCWEWYHIIKDPAFVTAHLQISSTGIIVQNRENPHEAFYVDINHAGFEVTNLSLPFPAVINRSCNGLVVLQDQNNPEVFHVVNLVTKMKVSLPRLDRLKFNFHGCSATLACTSDGRCKVVCVVGLRYPVKRVLVCTVGDDNNWREIDVEHMFPNGGNLVLASGARLSIAGVIYWIDNCWWDCYALDVDTETMCAIPTPKGYNPGTTLPNCVKLEDTICLVQYSFSNYSIKLWKLTEKKSGEWTAFDIDMRPIFSRLDQRFRFTDISCRPLLCLRNGEVWFLFRGEGPIFALVFYDGRNGSMFSHTFDSYFACYSHVNSLYMPENR